MSDNQLTIHDRLEDILNACVMRFQVIGEHVGKLLKSEETPLDDYPQIPWQAIYGLRKIISHEF